MIWDLRGHNFLSFSQLTGITTSFTLTGLCSSREFCSRTGTFVDNTWLTLSQGSQASQKLLNLMFLSLSLGRLASPPTAFPISRHFEKFRLISAVLFVELEQYQPIPLGDSFLLNCCLIMTTFVGEVETVTTLDCGRGVRCSTDIKKGTTLLREGCIACVLCEDVRGSYCDHCLLPGSVTFSQIIRFIAAICLSFCFYIYSIRIF